MQVHSPLVYDNKHGKISTSHQAPGFKNIVFVLSLIVELIGSNSYNSIIFEGYVPCWLGFQ